MHLLQGHLKAELTRIITLRAPEEAVGLILSNGKVIELTNTSLSPCDSFTVQKREIIEVLENENDAEDITLWHSHPGGGIGPSRFDMRQKTPFPHHLVITTIEGELVPTWY